MGDISNSATPSAITVEDVGSFGELSTAIAQICVRGLVSGRIPAARKAIRDFGPDYSDQVVRDLGRFFATLWGVNLPRSERSHCALCGKRLPHEEHELCSCYDSAGLGVYLDDVQGLRDVARYAELSPRTYGALVFERSRCASCAVVVTTTLEVLERRWRRDVAQTGEERPWRTPKVCFQCYSAQHRMGAPRPQGGRRDDKPRERPPQGPTLRSQAPALARASELLSGKVPAVAPVPVSASTETGAYGELGAPPALPHNAGAHAAPAPPRKGKGAKAGKGRRERAVPLADLAAQVASETEASPEA